eukprot:5123137-Karenia_brevis.AAC.1
MQESCGIWFGEMPKRMQATIKTCVGSFGFLRPNLMEKSTISSTMRLVLVVSSAINVHILLGNMVSKRVQLCTDCFAVVALWAILCSTLSVILVASVVTALGGNTSELIILMSTVPAAAWRRSDAFVIASSMIFVWRATAACHSASLICDVFSVPRYSICSWMIFSRVLGMVAQLATSRQPDMNA